MRILIKDWSKLNADRTRSQGLTPAVEVFANSGNVEISKSSYIHSTHLRMGLCKEKVDYVHITPFSYNSTLEDGGLPEKLSEYQEDMEAMVDLAESITRVFEVWKQADTNRRLSLKETLFGSLNEYYREYIEMSREEVIRCE